MPSKNKNARFNNVTRTQPSRRKHYLLIAVAVILVAAAAFGGYWKFGPKKAANTAPTTANSQTKGEPVGNTATTDSTQTNSQTSASSTDSGANKGQAGSGTASNAPLAEPSGNFVSNHHPNMSGSPAPNTMQSSCTTTPGATCQISFTSNKDGSVKTLPAKTTDGGGGAFWSYTLQSVGLTEGSWTVKATATLGTQTKTATDAMTLEVQP